MYWKKALLVFVMLLSILACQFGAASPTETPTLDPGPGQTSTAEAAAQLTTDHQAAMDDQATTDALATEYTEATAMVQSTVDALSTVTQKAENARETSTQAAALKFTSTAEIVQQITAMADSFAQVIQNLSDIGIVQSTDGEYHRLEDYEQSVAKLNYFFWTPTGHHAENFAIAADMNWVSASDKANWFGSGCGIVYGLVDNNTWVVTWLALDGYVRSMGETKGSRDVFAFQKWGTPELPEGDARTMLVVYDKRVSIFVNDVQANQFYHSRYNPGEIALTVFSGTNAGFGTRCTMTNIDLWIFD